MHIKNALHLNLQQTLFLFLYFLRQNIVYMTASNYEQDSIMHAKN